MARQPTVAELQSAAERKLLLEEGLKSQYQELDAIDGMLARAAMKREDATLRLPSLTVKVDDQFLDRDGNPRSLVFGKIACVKRWKIEIRPAV